MIGKTIVEQVDKDGDIFLGCDYSLTRKEIFLALTRYFPHIDLSKDGRIVGEYRGHAYSIRIKNITYLGNPHPAYKKRIQIPNDLQDFYDMSIMHNMTPLLLGIYSSPDGLTLFCDFNIEDFVNKKANNSSAHVYTSDMSSAVTDGIFQKIDFMGNRITVFHPDYVSTFLDDKFNIAEDSSAENHILSAPPAIQAPGSSAPVRSSVMTPEIRNIIADFFRQIPKRWNGIDCYTEMIADNYRNKYQPEWAGFYLEYLFEKYLSRNSLHSLIRYEQNKKKDGIDLDLFFPPLSDYGDLKAHSDNSPGIQGNDWSTIFNILNQTDYDHHIYYIVCEHTTYKDSGFNYEVTQFWNRVQNKDNPMSYHKRMKHHIDLKKVYILDINNSNKQFLGMFKQGVNSNGKLREPKIMIDHKVLDEFVIETIEL
ncbi:hypothetical protein ACQRBN_05125 [Bariatricus sp. SGI.154]|uniref:hypothetical protein n=1 Tax=Bariatricus sp. SGI.154 TaxID=3420549 RepID=UPI003D0235CE